MKVEKAPLPLMKDIVVDRTKEPPIEAQEVFVRGLVAPAAKLHGQTLHSSFELPLMEKPEAGQRADHHRSRPHAIAKHGGAPRLVVILDEPRRSPLIGGISREGSTNGGGSGEQQTSI